MIIHLCSNETTSNSYLIAEGTSALLIDAGDAEKARKLLLSHSWTLDMILLTHEHVDHISGLEEIRSMTGAPVVSSDICSYRIGDARGNLSPVYDLLAYSYTGNVCKDRHDPFICRPCEVVFQTQTDLRWQGHVFHMQLCPGHSPGSSTILMDNRFLFTGDYFLPDMPVNLDLPGSSKTDYLQKTEPWFGKILHPGMTLFPGHGSPYMYHNKSL